MASSSNPILAFPEPFELCFSQCEKLKDSFRHPVSELLCKCPQNCDLLVFINSTILVSADAILLVLSQISPPFIFRPRIVMNIFFFLFLMSLARLFPSDLFIMYTLEYNQLLTLCNSVLIRQESNAITSVAVELDSVWFHNDWRHINMLLQHCTDFLMFSKLACVSVYKLSCSSLR